MQRRAKPVAGVRSRKKVRRPAARNRLFLADLLTGCTYGDIPSYFRHPRPIWYFSKSRRSVDVVARASTLRASSFAHRRYLGNLGLAMLLTHEAEMEARYAEWEIEQITLAVEVALSDRCAAL